MTSYERRKQIAEDRKSRKAYDALLAEVAAFDRGEHLRETTEDTARIEAAAQRLVDWSAYPIPKVQDA